MSDSIELKAQARDRVGKGAARELRRNSMVPAVIYGDNKDPLPIAIPYKELSILVNSGGFLNTVLDVEVGGDKHRVLPKDYQREPVRDFFTHVDFLRVGKNTKVTVEIPVHYINEEESPGLRKGGVLNVVRHALEVSCRADAIPEYFEIDLTGLEIEDVVHASAITLPDGVTQTVTDRDPTMCSVAAPTVSAATDEEEGEEVAADAVPAGDEGEEEAEGGEE
ncbi:50S ribosomal protein L25/general stress protein Ctc [Salaquimonas pukyongi]|uniref:50S ribosomal protein L25/general stress protein Ctc n=1 Tax=Salaquimonas pukyongi TaxID=2712698 RepID=UPI00096B8984|nr:50S ribosomal protein L25/general stress protein Ctc [Salaquimonas pukyongi]